MRSGRWATWSNPHAQSPVFLANSRRAPTVVPHFVWHFLSDADIRFREPDYARQQLAQLMEIVVVLERGQVPVLD